MADAWLCDAGIRVTNFDRSVEFYTFLLDLDELKRVRDEYSAYVLFRDRRSGQRLELNWYSEKSPFYTPFVVGEGLDHLEVRVRDVATTLARLRVRGVHSVNRKLSVNTAAVEELGKRDPTFAAGLLEDVWVSGSHHIAYVADPEGNLICLYDHPEEDFDGPVPDHY